MVNVSRVVLSRRLGCQAIKVLRSSAAWKDGEFIAGPPTCITVRGIITVANPKDLQMVPEGDRLVGALKILTTVPLYQTGQGNVSDIVDWRGATYKVLTISPNVDYGFFRSILTRLDGDSLG